MASAGRTALLVAALGLSAALLTWPRLLGTKLGALEHAALPLLLLGVSAAFVAGFGFRPENRLARSVLSAPAAWALIATGMVLLFGPRVVG